MSLAAFGLSFLAGLLSVLSPCVLPLVPIVLGAAASEHKFGPGALAAGVTVSFVAIGLFVATVGFSLGLDGDRFRTAGAILMIGLGAALALPALQARIALAGGPVSNWADARISDVGSRGVAGQFAIGLLLGAVWSPCAGPTLGAASVLAAQGKSLTQVALTMLIFGIGAATPLALVGLLSRQVLMRWRSRMMLGGKAAKIGLGVVLALLGALIVSGLDRQLETWLVGVSPAWLTTLTTRF
jgi:cytochrome c biogenesis protein CcdA